MITTRKVAKSLAWSLGGMVALAVVLYLIALLVNLRDQPPSEPALQLRAALEEREQVPHDDNAYIYLLGFSAPEGMDPQVAGAQRLRWIEEKGYALGSKSAEPFSYVNLSNGRPKEVDRLRNECVATTLRCVTAFETNAAILSEWLASQPIMLERYRALLGRRNWLEFVADDIAFELPRYADVTEAQRMYLASYWQSGNQLDAPAIRDALQADLTFWRRALTSSDMLISKMIAVAAIRQHFALGSFVLRGVPPERISDALPSSWQEEFTAEERSMMRVMAGELAFAEAMMRQITHASSDTLPASPELSLLDRMSMPMFQHQDTTNQLAARYVASARSFEGSWAEYANALSQSKADIPSTAYTRLYNVTGDVLFDASETHFGSYAVRVGDLEGMRRAALVTAQLRSRSVPPEDIEEELAKADLKNHYTGAPFEWSEEERAVVFVGLEEGERGKHAYAY